MTLEAERTATDLQENLTKVKEIAWGYVFYCNARGKEECSLNQGIRIDPESTLGGVAIACDSLNCPHPEYVAKITARWEAVITDAEAKPPS